MPVRLQLRRKKGWRLPAGAVKVDRSTRWGNPYVGDGPCDRARVTQLFEEHLARPEQATKVVEIRRELRGQNLACWCPLDQPCHADVLLRIANDQLKPPRVSAVGLEAPVGREDRDK